MLTVQLYVCYCAIVMHRMCCIKVGKSIDLDSSGGDEQLRVAWAFNVHGPPTHKQQEAISRDLFNIVLDADRTNGAPNEAEVKGK